MLKQVDDFLTHIIKKSPIFYKLGMNGFAAYNVL